ncbi:aminotransferase class I/II-fold pyridoxal phosphate-dependent enzyme [Butyricimonas virosa]|uniref:Aminotransferase class I/II-fold pyridoxal phosphate-dependent enzyme n=1 Tax=Butyricimonas virosa TaxID=544645 RepID=A0A413IKS9_9BACT|nr:aminotransferase class I/II-fold pyridoxal phosphate-dependent enzyme [Butyricimonas virosa]MBS5626685.1 aminotransferase class I/II-fold pyridoxal phosphate-dependent enzyme [Porphyromonadaceae bacterium]RGL81094.1 aminotransferase class I/II-fold pyridoxal phosphate-dependent enzyme [Butyricimonas virosa]RGY15009.1 aminotransferase class I/II-fold pyridoxal phosphate-dependent enzyme [Butyricimonas virosa]RHI16947.1 aminotransferase class I/II-fold pyridoxal phosphate-dependent enzyme [But
MKDRIWLSLAHMGGREQEFIQEAFDTNWVVPLGPNVNAFEKALRDFLIENGKLKVENEGKQVVALSAGTAALHLGLILLGVGEGDEVICQSFTFSASANPIAYLGATPVFVDSEVDTWNMDPVLLEEAIKDRVEKIGRLPKAIIPVHLYGMPGKLDAILEVANRYKIPVLEDSAEALGSEYKGRKCGTFGEYAALSFNGNKIITTSGGGALVCPNEERAKRALFYATQAREQAPHYQHEKIGYNYRMSNICAGIGRGQMFVLDEHIARRRAIHDLYVKLLAGVKGVKVMCQPEGGDFNSNYWLTCITVDPEEAGFTRENVRLALDEDNIESRPLWKPMHLQPVFKDAPFYGNGTSERLFEIGLCLPSGPTLTDEDIERVTKVIYNL